MNKTSIEWCDLSVNPIRARRIDGSNRVPGHFCQKISPGCANCYSSTFQPRFGLSEFPGITKGPADIGEEVYLDEEVLFSVLRRIKPARIFWCDMTDLFGSWVPDAWIDSCFDVMACTPHLTHIVLTKRADRMCDYMSSGKGYRAYNSVRLETEVWPPRNVWCGISAENQEMLLKRGQDLVHTPATVRFVSAEPLLGALDFEPLYRSWGECIHWVIAGGESGHGARPCHPDWLRSLRDQCAASGMAFFFKQWGAWGPAPWRVEREDGESVEAYKARSEAVCATHAMARWGHNHKATHMPWSGERTFVGPDHAAMRCVGKKAAGRLLDGATHDAFPSSPLSASVPQAQRVVESPEVPHG